MTLPKRLAIHNFHYALDGGTTILETTDEGGRNHGVMLVQHVFPQVSESLDAIPGRLYFDGQLVPMRSELERGLLGLLRHAEIQYVVPAAHGERFEISPNALFLGDDIRQVLTRSPEDNIRALVAQIVGFVDSDEYVRFVEQVEQAADSSRYSVWVAWDAINRKHVVVKVGQVLGIGLRAAMEMLEQDHPLAEGISALEVSRLAHKYHAVGLRVRTQPDFRWGLPG